MTIVLSSLPKHGSPSQYCPPTGGCQYGQANQGPSGENSSTYHVGCTQTEHSCQDLDSTSFAIKLAHQVWSNLNANASAGSSSLGTPKEFYLKWASALEASVNATAKDPEGSGTNVT